MSNHYTRCLEPASVVFSNIRTAAIHQLFATQIDLKPLN
jgi:hypothetical protein